MPFYAPSTDPTFLGSIPDSVTIADFMFQKSADRQPLETSRPPFICGITGKQYSAVETKGRIDALTRGLAKELGWKPTEGTEWDKVIGVYSVNTVRPHLSNAFETQKKLSIDVAAIPRLIHLR